METDQDYLARRALEERAAADRATDPVVRSVHLDLAEEYERRASATIIQMPQRRRA